MDEDLKQYLADSEARLNARIGHVETKLLTEFHKWPAR